MDLCVKEGKRERTKFFFCEKRLSRNFIRSICLLEPFQRPLVNRWAAWTFSFNLSPVLHKTILLLLRGQSQSNYLTYLEKPWLFYHPLPSSLYTLNYPVQKGLLLAPFYRFVEKQCWKPEDNFASSSLMQTGTFHHLSEFFAHDQWFPSPPTDRES